MKISRRILLGVLFATVVLFFVGGTALAQDAVKVTPKNYKVLLENEHVRVLEFKAKAGEKEAMHSHPAMVVYSFTSGKGKFTMPDGKSVERERKAGTAIWREPDTHAYENLGPGDQHTLLVELKGMTAARKEPTKK